jgi:hypothetical protein
MSWTVAEAMKGFSSMNEALFIAIFGGRGSSRSRQNRANSIEWGHPKSSGEEMLVSVLVLVTVGLAIAAKTAQKQPVPVKASAGKSKP